MSENDPDLEQARKLYESYRNEQVSECQELSRFLDRWIIVVATGGLALSIHIPAGLPTRDFWQPIWLVYISRVLLVLAVVTALCGVEASRDAYERSRQIMDEEACHGPENLMTRVFARTHENAPRGKLDLLNRTTKYLMIAGLFSLTLGSILNPSS